MHLVRITINIFAFAPMLICIAKMFWKSSIMDRSKSKLSARTGMRMSSLYFHKTCRLRNFLSCVLGASSWRLTWISRDLLRKLVESICDRTRPILADLPWTNCGRCQSDFHPGNSCPISCNLVSSQSDELRHLDWGVRQSGEGKEKIMFHTDKQSTTRI